MNDWYCPVNFPIPIDEPVEAKGYCHRSCFRDYEEDEMEFLIYEWRPLDRNNEPNPKG